MATFCKYLVVHEKNVSYSCGDQYATSSPVDQEC